MKIKVQIKNIYGTETVYPACPLAVKFTHLTGTKTLTADKLRVIQQMGVEIEVIAPSITLAGVR